MRCVFSNPIARPKNDDGGSGFRLWRRRIHLPIFWDIADKKRKSHSNFCVIVFKKTDLQLFFFQRFPRRTFWLTSQWFQFVCVRLGLLFCRSICALSSCGGTLIVSPATTGLPSSGALYSIRSNWIRIYQRLNSFSFFFYWQTDGVRAVWQISCAENWAKSASRFFNLKIPDLIHLCFSSSAHRRRVWRPPNLDVNFRGRAFPYYIYMAIR